MYLQFYGLNKEPFNLTPDPEFFFLGEENQQALASLIYGIEKRKGCVVITGEVGVGKTTMVRSYLEESRDSGLKVIYVFNSNLSFPGLVKIIYQELGLAIESDDLSELVNGLHLALIEAYQQGINVALIIDEAQNMPVETLENLRMLSNLETVKDKLIQIILIGQPELAEILDRNELRAFKQRIFIRLAIGPFGFEESEAYIKHRLTKAGGSEAPIFTRKALHRIIEEAQGIPRILNILCDNALITGFGYRKKPGGPQDCLGNHKGFQGKASGGIQEAGTHTASGLWAGPGRSSVGRRAVFFPGESSLLRAKKRSSRAIVCGRDSCFTGPPGRFPHGPLAAAESNGLKRTENQRPA